MFIIIPNYTCTKIILLAIFLHKDQSNKDQIFN